MVEFFEHVIVSFHEVWCFLIHCRQSYCVLCVYTAEAWDVPLWPYFGLERWLHGFFSNCTVVNFLQPFVDEQIIESIMRAKALLRQLLQALNDKILAWIWNLGLFWEYDVLIHNIRSMFHHIRICERNNAKNHRVRQNSHSPPIHGVGMTLLQQPLRRLIVQIPKEAFIYLGFVIELLRCSKCTQTEISILMHQNILWPNIPMHNSIFMKKADRLAYIRDIEFDRLFWEHLALVHMKL